MKKITRLDFISKLYFSSVKVPLFKRMKRQAMSQEKKKLQTESDKEIIYKEI